MNKSYPTTEGAKGLDALQSRDLAAAYQHLETAYHSGDRHRHVLIGLALVARAHSKFEISLEAADLYLQIEPSDINANLVKADALTALGKTRTAANFYMAAIRYSQNLEQVPENLARDIKRAELACEDAHKSFEKVMKSSIDELDISNNNSRIQQTVDILMGKKQVYLQKPSKLYFPELPQIQFYDPADFDWTAKIKSGFDEIKSELLTVMAEDGLFEPYFDHNPAAPTMSDIGLNQDKQWSSFHLARDGKEIADNIARCPRTYEILSAAPIPKISGRSPNILFSLLEPGVHIPPHHGQINVRLLCHLPLIVPEGCFLRVGNQQREVVEGEIMLFDDSIEHEARNTSSERRVVLIFDVWRPEITTQERAMLCSIFKTIEELN